MMEETDSVSENAETNDSAPNEAFHEFVQILIMKVNPYQVFLMITDSRSTGLRMLFILLVLEKLLQIVKMSFVTIIVTLETLNIKNEQWPYCNLPSVNVAQFPCLLCERPKKNI